MDITEKVRLNNIHIRTAGSTDYFFPSGKRATFSKTAFRSKHFKALSRIITDTHLLTVLNLRLRSRKFKAEEHPLYIHRLSQRNVISTDTAHSLLHYRMRPNGISFGKIHRFEINIIQTRQVALRIGDSYFQIFPHIVLPFFQFKNHIHLPVHPLVTEILIVENQPLTVFPFFRNLYFLQ